MYGKIFIDSINIDMVGYTQKINNFSDCHNKSYMCGKLIKKGGNRMEDKKIYKTPEVTSYTDEEILAELGEAYAGFLLFGHDQGGGG